jgi:hypothetical protein
VFDSSGTSSAVGRVGKSNSGPKENDLHLLSDVSQVASQPIPIDDHQYLGHRESSVDLATSAPVGLIDLFKGASSYTPYKDLLISSSATSPPSSSTVHHQGKDKRSRHQSTSSPSKRNDKKGKYNSNGDRTSSEFHHLPSTQFEERTSSIGSSLYRGSFLTTTSSSTEVLHPLPSSSSLREIEEASERESKDLKRHHLLGSKEGGNIVKRLSFNEMLVEDEGERKVVSSAPVRRVAYLVIHFSNLKE